MLITNSLSTLSLLSLLVGVFAVQFLEEIPAPDLDQEKLHNPLGGTEAWAVAGPPYQAANSDYQITPNNLGTNRRIGSGGGGRRRTLEKESPRIVSTLQQQIIGRDARKFAPSEFLPGIGPFRTSSLENTFSSRPERTALKEVFSLDLPDGSIEPGYEEAEQISPVLVTVSDRQPLAALKLDSLAGQEEEEEEDERCGYEQFSEEQAELAGVSNCTKGGMRCERKCSQTTGEPVCTELLQTVCEDVPERLCQTVMEKHCKTIQEEVCDGSDGVRAKQCTVEMNEECQTVEEDICKEESKMECSEVNKEVCTTITEEVCSPVSQQSCSEVQSRECSLVPDAVCRNVTETRFDEKCWLKEESRCRTVYDTVWEAKCESVNITVPQQDCQEEQTIQMETKCEVVSEDVMMPVCVEVEDQEVEEHCEDVTTALECSKSSCKNVTRPVFMKSCREVRDEECEVIIEQEMQEKCTKVEMVKYEEVCNRITVEECYDTEEWVCEEEQQLDLTYGAPQAPVISQQQASYWRRKKSTGASKGRPRHSVLARKPKISRTDENNERERRASESDAGYENASEKVGNAFLQIGDSSFKSDYFGQIKGNNVKPGLSSYHATGASQGPALTTASPTKPSSRKCYVKPQKKCKTTPSEDCKQVPRTVTEEVCVPVTVSKPRQSCREVPREECDIMEMEETFQHCQVMPDLRETTEKKCSYEVKEKTRSACQEVAVTTQRKSCQEVPVTVASVKCETNMKSIELKEICVDIEVSLPREECDTEEKEECRYEPREITVQRCDPTVAEVCSMKSEMVCSEKCVEECQEKEKVMCMTIPQQECRQVLTPLCETVSKEECSLVPRETCSQPEENLTEPEPRCRSNTRLECEDRPREQCGNTYRSRCREEPQSRCTDRVTQDCKMDCSPVFWCKLCHNKTASQEGLF